MPAYSNPASAARVASVRADCSEGSSEPSMTTASMSSRAAAVTAVMARLDAARSSQAVVMPAQGGCMTAGWRTSSGSSPCAASDRSSKPPEASCSNCAGLPSGPGRPTGMDPTAPALPCSPADTRPSSTRLPPTKVPTKTYRKLRTLRPRPCSNSAMQAAVVSLANSTGRSTRAWTCAVRSTPSQRRSAAAAPAPSRFPHRCSASGAVRPTPTTRAQRSPSSTRSDCRLASSRPNRRPGSGWS